MRVSVVGGGAFGTTLATIPCKRGQEVCFFIFEEDITLQIKKQHESSAYLPGFRVALVERLQKILAKRPHVEEGVSTSAATYERSKMLGLDLHRVQAIYQVVYSDWRGRQAFEWLMSKPAGEELNLAETTKYLRLEALAGPM